MHPARVLLFALVLCLPLGMAFGQVVDDSPGADDEASATAADAAKAEAELAIALPPGASKEDEIAYLVRQDRALRVLGRGAQRLPGLRRLVDLTQGTKEVMAYWPYLWREEWRSGNQALAFQIGHDILESKQPGGLMTQATVAAQMASDYIVANQAEKAQPMMDTAENLRKRYLAEPPTPYRERANAIIDIEESQLLQYQGRYSEAEKRLIAAEREITDEIAVSEKNDSGANQLSIYQSDLSWERTAFGRHASILSLLGKNVEAETIAREGLRRAQAHHTQGQPLGEWYERIAIAALGERHYQEAFDAASQAIELAQTGGAVKASSQSVLFARNTRLEALLGQKRWADASAEYGLMLSATADDAVARLAVQSAPLEGLVRAKTGAASAAVEMMTRSVKFRTHIYGENNPRTIESRAVLALALAANGSTAAAQSEYHGLFATLFSGDADYADSAPRGLRGFFLPIALEGYLDMVASVASSGPVSGEMLGDAFLVCDRLRDTRVQEAITDSAQRSLVDANPALLADVRREQDARLGQRRALETLAQHDLDLGEAKKALVKAKSDKLDLASYLDRVKSLEGELDSAKADASSFSAKVASARASLAHEFPDYHALVNPRPIGPVEIARLLADNEALVAIYTNASHSFVFALGKTDAPVLAVTSFNDEAETRDVKALRDSLALSGAGAAKAFDFSASYDLYRNLIEPIAPAIARSQAVIFVASGQLGQLPLAVLVRKPTTRLEGAPWLVGDVAITHIPSATAFASIRADRRTAGEARLPFFGFGAPDFGTHASIVPPLPETRAEIQAAAHALGADLAQSTAFGTAATRSAALQTPLQDRRVVEFATHGLRAGDLPTLSQPALAMADAGPNEPWLLTLDDVLSMKLKAQLVVLSACNTASSDGLSAESISGLGRGFFFAGGHTLLLTHWEVETDAAQMLVTDFFGAHAQGGTWAGALRSAQIKMMTGSNATFHHPAYWAPYALLGDGAS
jgi:CHAT domain-containing protein/tetratricopeptide (TPR) repeat protein